VDISQNIRVDVEYTVDTCHSITCFRIINSNALRMGGVYRRNTRRKNLKGISTADNVLGQGGSDFLDGHDGNDEIAGNEGDGTANEITIASFVYSKT
jgi:hypothetical protein